MTLTTGVLLHDRYQIQALLGRGGPCDSFQDFANGVMYRCNRFNATYVLFADGTGQQR